MIAVFLWSCDGNAPAKNETVIARVGSEYLTLEYARKQIPAFLIEADSISAIVNYRNSWINDRIMYNEAVRLGIHNNDLVNRKLQKSRQDIINNALRDRIIYSSDSTLDVTDQEVQQFYQEHRDQFVLQERFVRLRHFVTETLEESSNAKNDLLRGVPWETVVERYALNKDETLRNAMRFVPVSTALPDAPLMRSYLRVIGISEISAIRREGPHFHFIQIVEDRPPGNHPDLEWIFEQIREWLLVEKRRRAIRVYEQKLFLQAEANNEVELFDVIPSANNIQ